MQLPNCTTPETKIELDPKLWSTLTSAAAKQSIYKGAVRHYTVPPSKLVLAILSRSTDYKTMTLVCKQTRLDIILDNERRIMWFMNECLKGVREIPRPEANTITKKMIDFTVQLWERAKKIEARMIQCNRGLVGHFRVFMIIALCTFGLYGLFTFGYETGQKSRHLEQLCPGIYTPPSCTIKTETKQSD